MSGKQMEQKKTRIKVRASKNSDDEIGSFESD